MITHFDIRTGLKVYCLGYLSNSSIKFESKTKAYKVELFESTVAFSGKTKCLGIGVVYVEEVEKKCQSLLCTAFQESRTKSSLDKRVSAIIRKHL